MEEFVEKIVTYLKRFENITALSFRRAIDMDVSARLRLTLWITDYLPAQIRARKDLVNDNIFIFAIDDATHELNSYRKDICKICANLLKILEIFFSYFSAMLLAGNILRSAQDRG